jgi:hypothetical protein
LRSKTPHWNPLVISRGVLPEAKLRKTLPHSGNFSPRQARFFAEQKMRPNEVGKKHSVSVNSLLAEALYSRKGETWTGRQILVHGFSGFVV